MRNGLAIVPRNTPNRNVCQYLALTPSPFPSVRDCLRQRWNSVADFSWRCLEIPGGGNVLGAFCFFYQVERDVHVVLLGEPGFANQLGMEPGAHHICRRLI